MFQFEFECFPVSLQMAVKAVPTRQEFLSQFSPSSDNSVEEDTFGKSLLLDMEDYITAMDVVLLILNDFYQSKGIDSDEQVWCVV